MSSPMVRSSDGGSEGEVESQKEKKSNNQDWIGKQLQLLNSNNGDSLQTLFQKLTNNAYKRKRSRRKKDQNKEAQKVERWHQNTKEWQEKLKSNKNVMIIKSKQESKKREKLDEEKMKWYGDELTCSKSWPDSTINNTIRIYGQNINGISRYTEYNEWEIMMDELCKQQVDIACLTEINLDVNKSTVKYKLIEQAKKLDKNCSLTMATSKSNISESESKRGGSLIMTRGNWSGREIEKGSEKLGRWTYTTLGGKGNKKLTIITLYRVCNQKSHGDGSCTIYMQQELDLIEAKRKVTDPREAILQDLTKFITTLREKNHDIILLGDMNGNVDLCKRIERFLDENDLYDAIKKVHPGNGPSTYDRGQRCIDLIAISSSIHHNAIKKCGYLPFYQGIFSDHRGMYVDLDTNVLFNKAKPDKTREIFKRFTTSQVPKCEKYINNLLNHIQEANIEKKIDNLRMRMENYETNGTEDIEKLIHECKTLFNKTTQIMKSSEKKVGKKPYGNGYPSSNPLRKAAIKVIKNRKYLRYERTAYRKDFKKIREYEKILDAAKADLSEKQKNAVDLREHDLNELAKKRAEQWDLKVSTAINVIKNSEESKRTHRKQRAFLKPRHGGVKKILVPKPISGVAPNE